MSINDKENFLLRNSKGEYINLYLSDKNKIIYDFYDDKGKFTKSSLLADVEVLDYSVDIDSSDRMHLVCLSKEGSLLYFINHTDNWSKNRLTSLDTKSNIFKYLTLKITTEKVHIFYSSSNLINPSVWTIHHISGDRKGWEKNVIISIAPGRSMMPFYVDYDKIGNIHLIYKNVVNGTQHVFYTFFSSFLQKWSKAPKCLTTSESDNLHPYLFTDSRDNLHVVWCTLINSNLQLVYKQFFSQGGYNTKWKSYNLPIKQSNITLPLIFEENGLLKITYKQNDMLKVLYSQDYGHTWKTDDKSIDLLANDITLINYASNFLMEKRKINNIYGKINNSIILYFTEGYVYKQKETINVTNPNQNISEPEVVELDIEKEEQSNDSNINALENSHFSLLDKANALENEEVKRFAKNTALDLDNYLSKTLDIKEIKEKIENMIYENTVSLDEKITTKEKSFTEVSKQLENIESITSKYKIENEDLLQLISSIEEKFKQNKSKIIDIEKQIHELKTIIENPPKEGFMDKVYKIFK